MHGADVLHSGRLGADEVDGVFEEGADDVEGTVDGADEGFDVGRTEGAVEGMDEWMREGADDTDGSAEGVDVHDEIKGSQIGLYSPLLDPSRFLLKRTSEK